MSHESTTRAVRWAGRVFVGVFAATLAYNSIWVARHWDELKPLTRGDIAPPFSVPSIDRHGHVTSDTIDLADLRGRWIVVEFWAEWCGPCRASLPKLQVVHQRYRQRGVDVIAIKLDGPALGRARDALAKTTFQLGLDTGVANRYGVSTIPHLVVIDPLGVIRAVYRGGVGSRELLGTLDRLMATSE